MHRVAALLHDFRQILLETMASLVWLLIPAHFTEDRKLLQWTSS